MVRVLRCTLYFLKKEKEKRQTCIVSYNPDFLSKALISRHFPTIKLFYFMVNMKTAF